MEDSPDFRKNLIRQNHCVELILEDIPGGCIIQRDELKNGASGFMPEGILIKIDSLNKGHLVKTAKIWSDVSTSATGVMVYKNHQFKAGDAITNTALTTISRTIKGIDTTAVSYDLFDIGSGFGASGGMGSILIQATASGVSGLDASYKYSPDAVGISELPVNLAFQNTGFGLLVRGRVKESLMPYPVDTTIKALLPLIRFV
ncbi:MAG: hypothetical protein IPJ16_13090 [Bacteroidales bacterium]|nr:hypothetical protein [Bacteroidales bacterium]